MGLIARELEEQGIATTSLSSALSITEAVAPPRACFVDYPLGHTAGKAHQPELQRSIVESALSLLTTATAPVIVDLELHWEENDDWKEQALSIDDDDDRVERFDKPQYQSEEDRQLAEAAAGCPTCIVPEPVA